MDKCSYFIKDKALFGGFPLQEDVDELEKEGVIYFINLTHSHESKITPYNTSKTCINFPIIDRHVPDNWEEFSVFITRVSDIIKSLKKGELIFLHCKGGHGRSGVVVACILCYMFNLTPKQGLYLTNECHKKRKIMKEKWRSFGAPQTFSQKNFVYKFFNPLTFTKSDNFNNSSFSNHSPHQLRIKNVGTFRNSNEAMNAYKNKMISEGGNQLDACEKALSIILKAKFSQHPVLLKELGKTGMKKLVYKDRFDTFLGIDYDNNGYNKLGISLEKIRDCYYRSRI